MKITMVGTGYVGLVTGTCFADTGNRVVCVDVDEEKIARLRRGEIPIYEPGLAELVQQNTKHRRLSFTTQLGEAAPGSDFVFIAVGTPQGEDGSADLSNLWAVVDQLAPVLEPQTVVVIKSTVPVGTNAQVTRRLEEKLGRSVDVASNPEFLKEGSALEDCIKPDRVVVGVRREEVADRLRRLYAPFLRTDRPFLVMSPESAEMTKYAANAMLATKISFINEMANLCQALGADINDVRRGIGHDARIGFAFLFPGLGYGGSCFPKDVRALQAMARQLGVQPRILEAVDQVNQQQKRILLDTVHEELGRDLSGCTVAVWGLSFKPRTDDVREAPSLVVVDHLLRHGARVQAHDPVAMENVRRHFAGHPQQENLSLHEDQYEALAGADLLVICTEWKEFQHPDLELMRRQMRRPIICDGRNLYEPELMAEAGFVYHSIGRAPVRPK